MLDNSFKSTNKSSFRRKNNRKRTKVFDPCISNKKKKTGSDSFGDENNSLELQSNQFYKNEDHLRSSKKDFNKTLDELCDEMGMNKYISEDDLSGEEFAGFEIPQKNDSVERCLKQMFEGLDEYATFNAKTMSTPKGPVNAFSAIDSNIKSTPWLFSGGINTCSIDKSAFKSTVDTTSYRTPLSERKAESNYQNESDNQNTFRSPLVDKTNYLQTPTRISDSIHNVNSQKTPFSLRQSSFMTTPHHSSKKSFSPEIELPPEIKRTLLQGVICYVDVKTNKEDCSSSVALELLSMGANVEKTFNKKVNHVVFKEGKPSTYFKAKKLGITMVSVLWLEACKKAQKAVDPTLYPPINVDKYESISPNGKKLPTLRTVQKKIRKHLLREAGLTAEGKSKVRVNWRNAVSEIKLRSSNSQENSQERLCSKKLVFKKPEKEDPLFNMKKSDEENKENDIIPSDYNGNSSKTSIISISDSPDTNLQDQNLDKSRDSNSYDISLPAARRNSAPARFITTRRKRKRLEMEPLATESQKLVTIDKLFARQITLNEIKHHKIHITDENSSVSQQSSQVSNKKRKLFNLEEAVIIIDTPDKEAATPPPVVYEFPYEDDNKPLTTNKGKSKSTSVRKIFKKVINKKCAAKKSLSSLLEQEECSHSNRSSLSYFADSKNNENKPPKDPPTIVCTSLMPEEVRKVSYVIGKLGVFDIEEKVSSRTTHLITTAPRRTINLLKALVRGAWILHVDWLYKSDEAGYWLNEEEFELKTFSYAVTEMRRERQAFGSQFCSELFSKCGPIYVSKRSIPSRNDVCELIKLCKGRTVSHSHLADYIIGGKAIKGENIMRLKEKWILDSITQNTLLDTERYLLKVDKT